MTINTTNNTGNLADWSNLKFWQKLVPSLHVCDPNFIGNQKNLKLNADTLSAMDKNFLVEGYTRFLPEDWFFDIKALAEHIEKLQTQNFLPVFSFVYDEYWLLFEKLRDALSHVLGADYQTMPAFWTWCLMPGNESVGFPPHRDRGRTSLFDDGRTKCLTIWIALTDATAENGCIYLLPADLDPNYNTTEEDKWYFDYNDIRAQPCPAGTVMCWNQAILHWGGRSSHHAKNPRVSISVEFQRADVAPFNKPLLPNDSLPPFEVRMKLIALQILQYKHLYPLSPDLEEFMIQMGLGDV